jgi:hypothetical protein
VATPISSWLYFNIDITAEERELVALLGLRG